MKNPQFLPNQADILPSEFIHWTDILTKFHNNWTNIVDFLVIAIYFPGWTFFLDLITVCNVYIKEITKLISHKNCNCYLRNCFHGKIVDCINHFSATLQNPRPPIYEFA